MTLGLSGTAAKVSRTRREEKEEEKSRRRRKRRKNEDKDGEVKKEEFEAFAELNLLHNAETSRSHKHSSHKPGTVRAVSWQFPGVRRPAARWPAERQSH